MSPLSRHTLRGFLAGFLSFAALGGFAAAARAADHGINVGNDKTLTPASRTIAIGDTVTWHWVGPDFDHIMQSAPGEASVWESHQGDNEPTGPTLFRRTYPQVGAFRYECRVHPDKMFGTITVTDSGRPTASFTYSPSAPTAGQRVDFDGMGSSDDGIVMGWEWDLNGDGAFETIGATPSWTYPSAGTVTVQLRVTDNAAKTHTTTKTVAVNAPPPPPSPPSEPGPPPPPPRESNSGSTPGPPVLAPALPKLTVTAVARQRGVDGRGIRLEFSCDNTCTATATGSIALPGGGRIVLAKATRTLSSKGTQKLVLAIPKSARTKLRTAWKRGKAPVATIVVTTPDGASVRKAVTLTR